MNLYQYLRSFKNIAWYPSAATDGTTMACLSFNALSRLGILKSDHPDCFIYTDYYSHSDSCPDGRFILDVRETENEVVFHENECLKVTAYNIEELPRIRLGFDEKLVAFLPDSRYYGRVFVADVLIEHKDLGRSITKLVYIFAENTQFAVDGLIKHGIKVRYAIHSGYGHGFGGGESCGAYMFHVLKDLGVRYFASDMGEEYNVDIADKYLSQSQRNEIPILHDLGFQYPWYGYDRTKIYKVLGFVPNKNPDMSYPRFVLY